MEGKKQVEGLGRLVAGRGEIAFSVVCLLYKRLFGGGGTGKTWRKAGVIFCAS